MNRQNIEPQERDPEDLAREGISKSHFEELYEGTPPWDIGRPQLAITRLEEAGRFGKNVLDVGCGTGENALYLAAHDHEVTGIDASATAIERARRKAEERGLDVRFERHDALRLGRMRRFFDSVIDCGLFHVFSDTQRLSYAESLAAALKPGGRCFILCFSEAETRTGGPRRVSADEIRSAFTDVWTVESIEPAQLEANLWETPIRAWLATLRRD